MIDKIKSKMLLYTTKIIPMYLITENKRPIKMEINLFIFHNDSIYLNFHKNTKIKF